MNRILPILFNEEMVRAIWKGRKGTTRRIIKGCIPEGSITENAEWGYTAFTPKGCISCRGVLDDVYGEKFFKLPYQKGDILYVRESVWQKVGFCLEVSGETTHHWINDFRYAATDAKPETEWNYSWARRPSIHMPKRAARIFLKVKDVRVERLQDITEEEAVKEGCFAGCSNITSGPFGIDDDPDEWTVINMFSDLWNTTIKKSEIDKYGWKANPWVWVIEFEKCEKPDNF